MLKQAIDGGIPIIRAHTTDLINMGEVLDTLTGQPVQRIGRLASHISKNAIFVVVGDLEEALTPLIYEQLANANNVLILVNPENEQPLAFNAGEIPVPRDLIIKHLETLVLDKDEVDRYLPVVQGLTIKEIHEIVRLTQATHGAMTPRLIQKTRQQLTGSVQGLHSVSLDTDFYLVPVELQKWSDLNKKFFLESTDARLVPRGLLFSGDAGTGKTQGTKWLAREWDVPLYRLDLGASLSKWHGESEQNLGRIFNTLDQEEPCILLLDEVEKLFAQKEDQGTSRRLLGQLLWWMQEHTTRVLTAMTTNDDAILPPELIRYGRIDAPLHLTPLSKVDATTMANKYLKTFEGGKLNADLLHATTMWVPNRHIVPAEIIAGVKLAVKKHLLKK